MHSNNTGVWRFSCLEAHPVCRAVLGHNPSSGTVGQTRSDQVPSALFMDLRIAEWLSEAGLRGVQRPASTTVKKSKRTRLNKSGSSRLIVCPDLGMITSPAVRIV